VCGIAGALVFDGPTQLDHAYIDRMRDTMAHRGPDGAGTWLSDDRRVGLGFRRLAIIDLSHAADQPMTNEDGRLRIVFNGEIYNHAAIRKELEQIGGHAWITDHSDTEVVLHAYEEWGLDALHRFRGMFALGLWDAQDQSLLLVRDRIGIKPLYWTVKNDRLTFASEIKAILTDPQIIRAIDEEAFVHYLSFLTTPAPNTLFKGIHKLPPGSWLRIGCDGTMEERRWWDVWDHVSPLTDATDDEIAERVLAELRTAVTLRKVSDVPVGVFLSGGIDSSTNAALFSEGEERPVKTFSIGYAGEYESYRNELQFARRMAKEVGAEHHEQLLSQDDLIDFLPRMVQLQDEPIADPVCVPVYYVSKLARDAGVVVAQVGEGADELFLGYSSWKRALDLQRWDDLPVPSVAKSAGLAALRAAGKDQGFPYEWLRRGASAQPVFWGGAEAFTQRQKERLLSPRIRKTYDGLTSWDPLAPIRQRFEAAAWDRSHLNWMTYLDLNFRLPELLLMRVDKMSMGVSLEGRVPFLDHEFVALAMSIPTAVKTRDGLKYILKKAVRGVIPQELIDRPKQGFGVPIVEWYRDRLGDQIRADVAAFTRQTDLLVPAEVDRLLAGPAPHQAWYLHNLALWWREYVAP
jgi:asparagine synthase (glutamine-hydrolysing)